MKSIAVRGRSTLLLALLVSIPFTSAASTASADPDATVLQRILTACQASVSECESQFVLYSRADEEANMSGGFSFPPFLKMSDQTFWGRAEELYYTEITMDGIDYQVGYGYVVAARQQDAKPSVSGSISAIPASGSADVGLTQFSASIIGVAPDEATCATPNLSTDRAFLCSIDIQPTVTQAYYQSELGRLSSAFEVWRKDMLAHPGTRSPICPQVINYRYHDPLRRKTAVLLSTEEQAHLKGLMTQLSAICVNKRPNAHVSYKNSAPNMDASGGGSNFSASQTILTQSYYRSKYYLADTLLRNEAYYDPADQYGEVYITGLTGAASLPSILAAVITLNATTQNQRIHATTHCISGANSINLAAFSGTTASNGPIENPVQIASAYGSFVDGIRAVADSNSGVCR